MVVLWKVCRKCSVLKYNDIKLNYGTSGAWVVVTNYLTVWSRVIRMQETETRQTW